MDGKAILVVEDDDDARADFGAALREHGFRVRSAANGQAALDNIHAYGPPDLILLDMALAVVDGWHFLQQRDARTARVPFLILTALVALAISNARNSQLQYGGVRTPFLGHRRVAPCVAANLAA